MILSIFGTLLPTGMNRHLTMVSREFIDVNQEVLQLPSVAVYGNESSVAIVRFNECPQHASSWLWKVLRFNDGPQNASLWIGVTSVALVFVAVAKLLL